MTSPGNPKRPRNMPSSSFLSQGRPNVANVVNAAKEKDITIVSVVNAVGSLIAGTICWEFTAMLDVRMPLLVPGHSLPRSLFSP
jgi:hypothetical protein